MTIDELRTLLDYHYWARDRMLDAIDPLPAEQFTRNLGNSFGSIRDTAVHVYSAEWIWHARWIGESPTMMIPFDRFADVASLRAAWATHEREMRAHLESRARTGLDAIVEYRLLNGTASRTGFLQMLQHVVNHASYHRGQITTLLRQLGAAPPKSMDMITFYRERL
jgi:uncharacterized damage-inducible protein DinB